MSTLQSNSYNIEKYRKKARDNKNKFYKIKREKLNEYKKGGCIICGEKELVCLDFHHLDSSEKDFGIGKQFHIKQFSKIEEEIKKCVVLCANCHRKVHANIIKLQGWLLYYVKKDGNLTLTIGL